MCLRCTEQFKWRENIGRKGLHIFTPINWCAQNRYLCSTNNYTTHYRVAEDNYKDPWWGNSVKFAQAFRNATGTNATYIEASALSFMLGPRKCLSYQ